MNNKPIEKKQIIQSEKKPSQLQRFAISTSLAVLASISGVRDSVAYNADPYGVEGGASWSTGEQTIIRHRENPKPIESYGNYPYPQEGKASLIGDYEFDQINRLLNKNKSNNQILNTKKINKSKSNITNFESIVKKSTLSNQLQNGGTIKAIQEAKYKVSNENIKQIFQRAAEINNGKTNPVNQSEIQTKMKNYNESIASGLLPEVAAINATIKDVETKPYVKSETRVALQKLRPIVEANVAISPSQEVQSKPTQVESTPSPKQSPKIESSQQMPTYIPPNEKK